ncbi:MAG: hypothetical protein OEQ13_04640 [Acidobacteriota bacterium]|nr:hypothetical protein [Acidobacteriota bacterium]
MSRRPKAARERADVDPTGPAAGAVVLPALAGAIASVVVIGFQPDDLFIYLRMARNVLEGQGWGFNAGEPINIASSAIWLLVLTLLGKLFGVSAMVAQLASGFASAAGIAGVACLAGRLAGDRRASWAAGLALAGDAWMGRWFWSGLETGLGVAVVSWALALRVSARAGSGRDRAASLLLAVAPLVRPELVLLPVAAIAASLLEPSRRSVARAVSDSVALALVGLAWSSWAIVAWGSVLPSTVAATGTPGAAHISVSSAIGRIALVVLSTQALAFLAATILSTRWTLRSASESETAPGRREVVRTIVLFAVLLTAGYAVQHVRVYPRYVLPLTGLIVALGMAGIVSFSRRARTRWARAAWIALVAATLAGNVALSSVLVVPKTRAYARSMREVIRPLAERLARETAPDATIALPDIGTIGFLTGRRVVDLSGLATPEILPYKRSRRLPDFLREHRPDVLIGIEPKPRKWSRRLADLPLVEVGVYRFEGMLVLGPELLARWRESWRDVSRLDPMYVTVYRVPPAGEPSDGATAEASAR